MITLCFYWEYGKDNFIATIKGNIRSVWPSLFLNLCKQFMQFEFEFFWIIHVWGNSLTIQCFGYAPWSKCSNVLLLPLCYKVILQHWKFKPFVYKKLFQSSHIFLLLLLFLTTTDTITHTLNSQYSFISFLAVLIFIIGSVNNSILMSPTQICRINVIL
jgi:hypothetical protein